MIYWKLFLSFLQIGAFSFGGGYAAMPLIQSQVVDANHWLSKGEFTDLITISQMTPGPIAVNSATFVGLKIAGLPGAIFATFGCILPSCLIVCLLAWLYLKYKKLNMMQGVLTSMRPAVVAMIASAGTAVILTSFFGEASIVQLKNLHLDAVILFALSLLLLRKKMSPILVMVLAGGMEVGYQFLIGKI